MSVSFPVQVTDFKQGSPWAHLNGVCLQSFTWSSMIRAAMVAGYPRLASIPSRQFAQWRTAGLRLALRSDAQRRLVLPPEWPLLDRSEKATVSSLLGVVVTKLLIERLLNAPLLLFLDVHFKVSYAVGSIRLRPDFVAMDPAGGCYSVEAKGRAVFHQGTLEKGKAQAKALTNVNGRAVLACVVCMTSFRQGVMGARLADPEPNEQEQFGVEIEPLDALLHYYSRLRRFQEFSERLGEATVPNSDLSMRLWHSAELDAKFGIVPELEEALNQRSAETALAILADLGDPLNRDRSPHLGADGIVVIPGDSWRTVGA